MIRVSPAPEPADFDETVRTPGRQACQRLVERSRKRQGVRDIPSKDLPVFWRRALPAMHEAYGSICAYRAVRIDTARGAATIDHFKPKSRYQDLAYEWANFRLSTPWMNSNKGDHEDVLDPFEITDGWFVLDGAFAVAPQPNLSAELTDAVSRTIGRLKLNDPTLCHRRAYCHDRYMGPDDPWPLSWLLEECPFVAHELARLGRLREGDRL